MTSNDWLRADMDPDDPGSQGYSPLPDTAPIDVEDLVVAQPWPEHIISREPLLALIADQTSWDWPDNQEGPPEAGCDTRVPLAANLIAGFADRIAALIKPQIGLTRKQARQAIAPVLSNASNYPRKVQPHLLGQSITPLLDRLLDALDAVAPASPEPADSSELARINRNLLTRIRELEQIPGVLLSVAECRIAAAGLNWAVLHPTDGAPDGWGSAWTTLAERLRAAQ